MFMNFFKKAKNKVTFMAAQQMAKSDGEAFEALLRENSHLQSAF